MLTWIFQKPRRITKSGPKDLYGVGDCLSTDAKPTENIGNGSVLREMDTGKNFKFDADGAKWLEQPASGGGGGGSDVVFATPEEVMGVLSDG